MFILKRAAPTQAKFPQKCLLSGVKYVVVGHSERRQYFGETDQTVNLRTLAAVNAGLTAIVCVGETLEQRELGYTETLLKYQTKMALTNITKEQLKNIVIAYEPVWAIGTGVTATAEQVYQHIDVCGKQGQDLR